MPSPALSLLLALAPLGCASWPRADHLPAGGDTAALPAGTDPGDTVPVTWQGPTDELENGDPRGLPLPAAVTLSSELGVLVAGQLDGTGWIAGATPDRTGSCGTLGFPLTDQGSYAGDVDWLAVQVDQDGWLCGSVALSRDGLFFDLVPYTLDDCDEPAAPLTDDQDQPLGFDQQGATVTWSAPVQQGDRVGVALAAAWPQDPSGVVAWTVGLSLSPTGRCPSLPASP